MRIRGVVLLLSLALAALAEDPASSAPLVFLHVTVINPGTSSVLPDQAVVVSGGRIRTVASAKGFQVPSQARSVDGSGQFLIPGLWDMHVHTVFGDWFPRGRDVILPLFVANGVTGVRDMGGELPTLLEWREQISAGKLVGPRMVFSGPMLDGYLADGKKTRFPSSIVTMTPAQAVAAVDSLKSKHADFIKVQSEIPLNAYLAAAAEAHKQGLPFVGHVPSRVKLAQAVNAGQKSVEHLMGIFEGCSTEEDRFIQGKGNNKLLMSTQEPHRCAELVKLLGEHHVWQVPTMAWGRQGSFLDSLDWQHQPLDKYVPAYWRDVTWHRFNEEMMPDLLADSLALRKQLLAAQFKMMGTMHRAGVPFLAGTDTAPGIYVMPGFSLHDELADFVEAGFTPMQALATATSNPAEFLEKKDMGAVAAGGVADLVLLRANPLDNIRNTQKIAGVVANGRFFDRAALDQMLARVSATAKKKD